MVFGRDKCVSPNSEEKERTYWRFKELYKKNVLGKMSMYLKKH